MARLLNSRSRPVPVHEHLKIGDAARLVGVSPSLLRSWECLGLIRPKRSGSRYRLYTREDLRLLKRARYLRRSRGLNAPAIVEVLKEQGLLRIPHQRPSRSIGPRLRSLRLKRHLSLSDVAAKMDVSVGFLSAVERGQMSPSVATLRKLARFYQLNILSFFNPEELNPYRVRPGERKVLDAGRGVRMELLAWGNTVMEPHLFRIAPGAGSGESYTHDGEEFLFLLRGRLEISLDEGEPYLLEPGDSFYFESGTPHRWRNPGRVETLVIWVNTPPTF